MIDVNTTDSTVPVNVDRQVTDNIYTDWDKKAIPQDHIKSADKLLGVIDNTFSSVPLGKVFEAYNSEKEYGVCYDNKTKSPTLERVGDSVGLVANIGMGKELVHNDFDNIYPWSQIRRCTLNDQGVVTSYKGDSNYKQDGSIGQVMVEIPKFYIKRYHDIITDKDYTYICATKKDGYRVAQPFLNKAGQEIDHIYIGAFMSEIDEQNIPHSEEDCSNVTYNNYMNNSNYHKARGKNWHCIDVQEAFDVIQPLFMIEFATTNSESIFKGYIGDDSYDRMHSVDTTAYSESTNQLVATIDYIPKEFYVGQEICIDISADDKIFVPEGFDYVDQTYRMAVRRITSIEIIDVPDVPANKTWKITFAGGPIKTDSNVLFYDDHYRTGLTDLVQASSGVLGDGRDTYVPFVWRGLENPWSYTPTMLDGVLVYRTEKQIFYTDDIDIYGTTGNPTTSSDYKLSNLPLANSGYISRIESDKNAEWLMFPTDTTGTSDTGYCDTFDYHPRAQYLALLWGGGTALEGGVFALYYPYYSNPYYSFPGRLAYRPYS